MRILGALLALGATAVTAVIVASLFGPAPSGTQPWSNELADNLWLARTIPFGLGLGVLLGVIGGKVFAGGGADGRSRFSPAVVVGHWIAIVGFLIAVSTGIWQYMGGILDWPGPLPVYLYYRLHYIGALIILVALAGFLAYWWITGDRSLLFPLREWRRFARGALQELPRWLGPRIARVLRIDINAPAGASGTFTFYERAVSFPGWSLIIGLVVVTGLVKALRYTIEVPGLVVFIVSTLHVTGAVLLTIKILDHLRYTLERWPLVIAITTSGRVPRGSETWVREPGKAPAPAGGDE